MPITHKWNGTVLTITSDSGSSSMDLKGAKGDDGARGAQGIKGERGGGALINDNVISKDEVWSSSAIMDRFAEGFAYEGNPVVCNALPNTPFDITTNIEVKQEGSGTPYPAGGAQNQLCILPDVEPFEVYGITYSCLNGVVKAKGTATAHASTGAYISYDIPKGTTGTYFVSGTSGAIRVYMKIEKDGVSSFPHEQAFTLDGTETQARLFIQVSVGETVDGNIYPMLNAGSSALPWEAPSNIRPIVGMDAIKLVRSGKNIVSSYVVGSTTTQYNASLWIETDLKPNTTYTLSFVATDGNTLYINEILTDYQYIKTNGARQSITFTTKAKLSQSQYDSGKGWIILKNSKEQPAATAYNNIQLEVGETASPYEAYKGNTYTMELGQTVYSGSIDWNRGVMVVDKKYISLTADNITRSHSNYNKTCDIFAIGYSAVITDNSSIGDVICSHCKTRTANEQYVDNNNCVAVNDKGTVIITFKDILTEANAKAYITEQANAGNPVQVCYKLAEPREIQLTPQVIRALSGTNTLYTDASNLLVFGRVDTMATIKALEARIAALEAAGGE